MATGAAFGLVAGGLLVVSTSEQGAVLALLAALLLLGVALILGVARSIRALRLGRSAAIAPLLLSAFLLFYGLTGMLGAFSVFYGWDG